MEHESLFSFHILETARRVKQTHELRLNDADHAFREWEHNMTLSNAIRRDDARKALLDLSDAYTLALAILETERWESEKNSH